MKVLDITENDKTSTHSPVSSSWDPWLSVTTPLEVTGGTVWDPATEPDEELAIQEHYNWDLKEFKRLRELPAELQLQIWREYRDYPQEIDIYELLSFGSSRTQPPLPVTLRICRDSRSETLRYHHVLQKVTYNFSGESIRSFICVDPVRDIIYQQVNIGDWYRVQEEVQNLGMEQPRFARSLERIELCIGYYLKEEDVIDIFQGRSMYFAYILEYYHGLKEICFTMPGESVCIEEMQLATDEDLEIMRVWAVEAFERLNAEYSNARIPRVIINRGTCDRMGMPSRA